MNADRLREEYTHRTEIQTRSIVIERVARGQDERDDRFIDTELAKLGIKLRENGFTRTGADDDHELRSEVANEAKDVDAGGPRNGRKHERDEQQAAGIKFGDQLTQREERGGAKFADGEGDGAEGSEGRGVH